MAVTASIILSSALISAAGFVTGALSENTASNVFLRKRRQKPLCLNPACNLRKADGYAYCSQRCRSHHQRPWTPTITCIECRTNSSYVTTRNGLFCGFICEFRATSRAPGILELPRDHLTFMRISNKFHDQWKHPDKKKCTVAHVYLIMMESARMIPYYKHKVAVNRQNNDTEEEELWHGTTRKCLLGDPGHPQLCQHTGCALCSIVRISFDIALYDAKRAWGRFGRGIYTSATSSKADSYSRNTQPSPLKAMLLNRVTQGRPLILHRDSPNISVPPPGYHSVIGMPGPLGQLNYDECVVYSNDAIRPDYLVLYK